MQEELTETINKYANDVIRYHIDAPEMVIACLQAIKAKYNSGLEHDFLQMYHSIVESIESKIRQVQALLPLRNFIHQRKNPILELLDSSNGVISIADFPRLGEQGLSALLAIRREDIHLLLCKLKISVDDLLRMTEREIGEVKRYSAQLLVLSAASLPWHELSRLNEAQRFAFYTYAGKIHLLMNAKLTTFEKLRNLRSDEWEEYINQQVGLVREQQRNRSDEEQQQPRRNEQCAEASAITPVAPESLAPINDKSAIMPSAPVEARQRPAKVHGRARHLAHSLWPFSPPPQLLNVNVEIPNWWVSNPNVMSLYSNPELVVSCVKDEVTIIHAPTNEVVRKMTLSGYKPVGDFVYFCLASDKYLVCCPSLAVVSIYDLHSGRHVRHFPANEGTRPSFAPRKLIGKEDGFILLRGNHGNRFNIVAVDPVSGSFSNYSRDVSTTSSNTVILADKQVLVLDTIEGMCRFYMPDTHIHVGYKKGDINDMIFLPKNILSVAYDMKAGFMGMGILAVCRNKERKFDLIKIPAGELRSFKFQTIQSVSSMAVAQNGHLLLGGAGCIEEWDAVNRKFIGAFKFSNEVVIASAAALLYLHRVALQEKQNLLTAQARCHLPK